jgi:hypothetical protein
MLAGRSNFTSTKSEFLHWRPQMPNHDRRLDALEAAHGAKVVGADELRWAREADRRWSMAETKEESQALAGDGIRAMLIFARNAGGWALFVKAALATPLDQIRVPRWLRNEMLAELDAGRPDLARRVRAGEMAVEEANRVMLLAERYRGQEPPEPTPEPEWFAAEIAAPAAANPTFTPPRGAPMSGPSPYATPHTAHQPDPRAERLAQWRRDEEAAELERIRDREAREYRPGRNW